MRHLFLGYVQIHSGLENFVVEIDSQHLVILVSHGMISFFVRIQQNSNQRRRYTPWGVPQENHGWHEFVNRTRDHILLYWAIRVYPGPVANGSEQPQFTCFIETTPCLLFLPIVTKIGGYFGQKFYIFWYFLLMIKTNNTATKRLRCRLHTCVSFLSIFVEMAWMEWWISRCRWWIPDHFWRLQP